MIEDDFGKPKHVSRIVVNVVPEAVAPRVQNDELKAKLLAVLQEDPGTVKVTENPWLHDVFVRKVRTLVGE
jgi:hypothetical protein